MDSMNRADPTVDDLGCPFTGPWTAHGFAFVVVVALAVRLAVLHPILDGYDFIKYPALASALLQHGATEPFNASPLYIYFWCAMHRIFDYTTFGPRIVQLLIGSLSCGLMYLLALRVVPFVWALITGLVGATYAPLVAHDGIFLSEFLVVFLNTCALLCFWEARRRAKVSWWVLGGVAWGLSAITRPNIVLLGPFVLWWAWGSEPRQRRRNLQGAAAACGVVVLLVGAIMVRNWRVGGEAIPVMSDGGIVFYIANNELDRGLSYSWPRHEPLFPLGQIDPTHRIAREVASKLAGRPLSIGETSDFWFAQGLKFIGERPRQWLVLCARKLWYYFNDYEVPDTMAQYWALLGLAGRQWRHFGEVAPLLVLGCILALRRWRQLGLLFGVVAVYTLTSVLLGVESRYRLPMMPAALVLSAAGAHWLYEAFRARRWRRAVPALVLVVALIPATNWRDFEIRKAQTRLQVNLELLDPATAKMDRGKYAEAIHLLQRVVSERKSYDVVVNAAGLLAHCYRQMGDLAAAERAFRLKVGPLCTDLVTNDPVRPRAELEEALRRDPNDLFALRELGYVAWKERDWATAERACRRVVWLAPQQGASHFNLAAVLLAAGKEEEGRHELRMTLQLMPEMAPARMLAEQLGEDVARLTL